MTKVMRCFLAGLLLMLVVAGCRSARRGDFSSNADRLVHRISYDNDSKTFEGCVDGCSVIKPAKESLIGNLASDAVDSAIRSAIFGDDDDDGFGPSKEERVRAEWNDVLAKYPDMKPPAYLNKNAAPERSALEMALAESH